MMKTTIKVILTAALAMSFVNIHAQNVGINATGATPNSSAMLDVSATNKGVLIPNVSLTSLTDATTISSPATSLLVYNTNTAIGSGAGYYYNSGTSGSPVWTQLQTTGQSVTDYYTTGSLTVTTATGFTAIPGYPVTANVPANTSVLLTGSVGVSTNATGANAYSEVDVVVVVDGSLLANGGYCRLIAANNGGLGGQSRYANFSVALPSLTAGNHTFGLYAAGVSGSGSSAATVAGNASSVLQGTLTLTMVKK